MKGQNKGEASEIASENLSTEYDCPLCRDIGWVYPPGSIGNTIRCKCKQEEDSRRKAEWVLKFCNLPPATERMTLENFEVRPGLEEAHKAACEMADSNGEGWLTLLSKRDRGKTHLAVGICRRWLERGKAARYVHVPLMLEELREGYDDKDRPFSERFQHFLSVPLLVLDDLGVEKPTQWAQEKLETIIDYRYMNLLPLVVTTNNKIDELRGDAEHRIASRLQRYRNGKVIAIDERVAIEFRIYRRS